MCDSGRIARKRKFLGLRLKAKVFQEAKRLLDPLPPPQPMTPNVEDVQVQLKYLRKPSKNKKAIGNKPTKMTDKKITLPNSVLDMPVLGFFNYDNNY
ncbi:unnamed protein product [Arctia plantaginis]|uniref:Uncharacterized protein n=1 Tax=Arctia plantaginis TaxID=874455 RepID=A0A8S1BFD7_ARCPL|nr:unnamed protein product [Arctia plantaginis]CAB3256803.1 unnamed protein product [Arctia plantaginis]